VLSSLFPGNRLGGAVLSQARFANRLPACVHADFHRRVYTVAPDHLARVLRYRPRDLEACVYHDDVEDICRIDLHRLSN
jgi:hypothetical protein